MHFTVKKRNKNGVVLNDTICLLLPFFPWTRREQEKKKHLSLAFLLSLFLSFLKPKKPDKTPYLPEP